MLIGTLAQATDVSRDTIRFYEKIGLIQGQRQANGYKHYPHSVLDTINFVKLAQELGFSLAEIRSILPILAGEGLAPEMVQAFIQEKVALIDQRITTLQLLRTRLVSLPIGSACPLRRDCTGFDAEQATETQALKLSA